VFLNSNIKQEKGGTVIKSFPNRKLMYCVNVENKPVSKLVINAYTYSRQPANITWNNSICSDGTHRNGSQHSLDKS